MATYEDYTEKTDLTFDGTYQLIGNDPSDATEDGYWYITADNLSTWFTGELDVSDIDLSNNVTTYDANLYLAGHNGTSNSKLTLLNLTNILTATANGLDLDSMFDSGGYQPLSGGQYQTTIADANVNNTVTTFAEAKTAIDALGTKINEIIVALETIGLIIT